MRKPTTVTISHPLESVVLAAFRRSPVQDRITLAAYMKGVEHFSGRGGARGDRAYLVVAEDVLGCMESQGKLTVDATGWYRPVPASRLPRSRSSEALPLTAVCPE